MAAPTETNVYRAAGQLCINPTNLGVAFPHGGTSLGLVSEARLRSATRSFTVRAEEYGSEVTEEIHLGRDWVCAVTVKGWDNDTLGTIFPNTAAGGSSGVEVISEPGGKDPGTLLTGNAVKLCFSPFESQHPGFLVYRAIPNVERSGRLRFQVARSLSFMAVFRGVRDASGRVVQIGLLEDLTL